MELNRVKILANRYFDGVTSRAEEQELREALRSIDNLDSELQALKTMLGAMESLHETTSPVKVVRPTISRRVVWLGRVASVAIAACAIFGIFLGINHREQSIVESPTIICHIKTGIICHKRYFYYLFNNRMSTRFNKYITAIINQWSAIMIFA